MIEITEIPGIAIGFIWGALIGFVFFSRNR